LTYFTIDLDQTNLRKVDDETSGSDGSAGFECVDGHACGYDLCPFEMLKDFPPVACASPELKQRVAEKFKSYLTGL